MPVADWNDLFRINFHANPPRISGITKLTRIRSQPMTSALNGVTTGALAGLILGFGVGVAPDTTGVAGAVTTGGGVDGLFAYVVAGPAEIARITCASTPSSTNVVANSSGFSESAGVTRYQ